MQSASVAAREKSLRTDAVWSSIQFNVMLAVRLALQSSGMSDE